MDKTKTQLAYWVVWGLVGLITILHYKIAPYAINLHMIHRELYFIPILLASFWFGTRFGALTAGVISLAYAPQLLAGENQTMTATALFSQIFVFFLVGIVLGLLSDRQKEQQKHVVKVANQAVLGRAAAAVGFEIQNHLVALEELGKKANTLSCRPFEKEFDQEIDRLRRMTEIMTSYVPEKSIESLSSDLNHIMKELILQMQKFAKAKNIDLTLEIDSARCIAYTDAVQIKWVIKNLILNALEFSPGGTKVVVKTHSANNRCYVEVKDEGPGISQENMAKIFTPFFTTKKNGRGITLAACRKTMHTLKGNIRVQSVQHKGSTFSVDIPIGNFPSPLNGQMG